VVDEKDEAGAEQMADGAGAGENAQEQRGWGQCSGRQLHADVLWCSILSEQTFVNAGAAQARHRASHRKPARRGTVGVRSREHGVESSGRRLCA
jgi:hypothetical protein